MKGRMLKNLRVFFLLLAGIALNVHMIIPHDHHIAGQEGACPVKEGEAGHHSRFPLHCHAFNDLPSDKVRPVLNSLNINSFFVAISSYPDIPFFNLYIDGKSIIFFNDLIPDTFLRKYSSLRAPPSLV
jgi:hypothetical protein